MIDSKLKKGKRGGKNIPPPYSNKMVQVHAEHGPPGYMRESKSEKALPNHMKPSVV